MSRPLRVGINARLLADASLRGWNRYTLNLVAALPAAGVEVVLLSDRPIHPDHQPRLPVDGCTGRVAGVRPYAVWEQVWLPTQCRRDRVDVLHAPAHFGLPRWSGCPRVLTLHDAIDGHRDLRHAWRLRDARGRARLRQARRDADRIITVSHSARAEIEAQLGVDPARITVIPEAADPVFHQPVSVADRERVARRWGLDRPYFVYVGGSEERKNLPFLVRALAAADLPAVDLVLAGGDHRPGDPLATLATSLDLGDRYRTLGPVLDADLPALLAGALAFVYPSRHEGFGLQLCEAMAVGCPVLAAAATSLPEILGDGGICFPLDDPTRLASLLRHVWADAEYRENLRQQARDRSAAFSWERTAAATAAVYRDLVARAPGGCGCGSVARC